MFPLNEIWDNFAYIIYNFFALSKFYLYDQFKYKNILNKNKSLKNIHKGERCFIVMNGPSINSLDLSHLENEIVFCSNYFYLSNHVDTVKPNYYCICDSDTFLSERIDHVHELMSVCHNAKFIFNKSAMNKLTSSESEKTFFVYGMHMPTLFKIRTDLSSISSSFTNVSMFSILCAIYMGFKEIYILGNDFAPGTGLSHCYGNTDTELRVNQYTFFEKNRINICTFYWSYYLAHLQSFYIEKEADQHNVKIYNANPNSYIRAYTFVEYEKIF